MSKDLIYVYYTPHLSKYVTICLWMSTLFTVLFTTLTILVMSAQEFVNEYGFKDFKDIDRVDQVTYCNLLKAKLIRSYR